MIDVIRSEPDQMWRYVCLIDGCGYRTRPLAGNRAQTVRKIHRHRHLVGRAPMPWHPAPTHHL